MRDIAKGWLEESDRGKESFGDKNRERKEKI